MGGVGGARFSLVYDVTVKSALECICSDLDVRLGQPGVSRKEMLLIKDVVVRICSDKQKEFLLNELKCLKLLPFITLIVKSVTEKKGSFHLPLSFRSLALGPDSDADPLLTYFSEDAEKEVDSHVILSLPSARP